MARVTVEDCVDKVPNRFELVMLASHRAREISSGGELTVDRDNDKNPVVALREIADETQQSDDLRERMIEANQTHIEVDDPEAYYVYQTRMSVVWPVDREAGKLIGEETYTGTDGFAGIADRKIAQGDIVPLSI